MVVRESTINLCWFCPTSCIFGCRRTTSDTEPDGERDVEFLKLQIAKDREEKEEFKRQIQALSAENQKLKSRIENGEKGSREEEHRFSTPEEQDSKPLSGLREEDTDWLRRRSSEESGGQKEAARPPFLPEAAD